jgi:hypothetical protein
MKMEGLEDAYNFKYHKGMHYKLTTNVQPALCLARCAAQALHVLARITRA